MLMIIGTVTVPLARMIEAKIELAPKNRIDHNTINNNCCPSATTLGSVMNNAIKHSNAKEIVVRIARNQGKLEVSIKDDGRGLDLQLIKQSSGIGWKNIYSRVELINGVIDMNSTPGAGTNVQVLVPAA